MPNMGCMLGTAYQTLVRQLSVILDRELPETSVPEYMILRSLYCRDGMQQCEIADIIGRNKGVISRTVKGMVEKGFVRTESVSHKCLKVFLTDKGNAVKAKILAIAHSRQKDFEELLGADKLSIFSECLEKIIES